MLRRRVHPRHHRLSIVRQKKRVVVRQIRPIGVLTLEEALKRGDEVCGVILYKYPGLACQGRKKAFGRVLTIQEPNRDLTTTARVVVHPKHHTTGLGTKLVKETLPLVGKPYVEMVAVMAKYNPSQRKRE